jgi:hypothetical protein
MAASVDREQPQVAQAKADVEANPATSKKTVDETRMVQLFIEVSRMG